MKVCVFFLFFALVSFVYGNCGCLNCNKQFHVLSAPGAEVKVIHRSAPYACPTSLPYSVEIPVTKPHTHWGRSYGYEVQAEKVKPEKQVYHCPIPRKYDYSVQVPHYSKPKYLVGLAASTDRIVLDSPQCPSLPPACQRPIIDRLPVYDDFYDLPHTVYKRYALDPNTQRTIWKPNAQRNKRSINYKLLSLNSNNFQMSNRRKNLKMRKPQFVMVPDDSLRRGVTNRKRFFGRRRFKRRIEESDLPFFESEEEERPKSKRRVGKKAESVPEMMQSMPLLKMLSLPLKYMSNLENNPIVGAIPKVLRVSKKYFINFAKNFVDDYKKLKRKKAMQKRLYKREMPCKFSRRKREVPQESDVDYVSCNDLQQNTQYKSVAEEFLSILKEVAQKEDQGQTRQKREDTFLQDILKFLKAERIPARPRKKRSTPDLETKTVKEEISKTAKRVQKLLEEDFSKDLEIYSRLLKLQQLKSDIVKQSKESKIKEAEELKQSILEEIILKIAKNEDENVGKWIKIIIYLQKFHCALQSLKENPKHQVIQVLSSINFLKESSREGVLKTLKQKQSLKIQREVEFLNSLKHLMASRNKDQIKKESALIWQSNNLKKLQRESIVKIVEKMLKKQRLRQELKILFDLQKQLEECHENQKLLLDEVSK